MATGLSNAEISRYGRQLLIPEWSIEGKQAMHPLHVTPCLVVAGSLSRTALCAFLVRAGGGCGGAGLPRGALSRRSRHRYVHLCIM